MSAKGKRVFDTLSLGALTCLLVVAPTSVFGATFFTAKTGSDSNSCAQAQSDSTPRQTIAGGVECMSGGDTLIVGAGTYNESLNALPSGSAGKYTSIQAKPGDSVVISRSGGTFLRAFDASSKAYIEFDGLSITGQDLYNAIKIQGGTHHLRIRNCEIFGAAKSGILDATGNGGRFVGGHEILNNVIYNNGGTSGLNHGIYITSSENTIWNNDFFGNSGYGIDIWTSGHWTDDNDVQYNRVYDNGATGTKGGITVAGNNNLIANNLVWDNQAGGIWFLGGNGNKAYNNTVYNNLGSGDGGGITTVNARNTIVKNNILYGNTYAVTDLGSGTVFEANLTTDPSFVNVDLDDFRIESTSDARDAGVTLSEGVYDFNGVPRPQGAAVDVGAYEYTGASAIPANTVPNPPGTFSALVD